MYMHVIWEFLFEWFWKQSKWKKLMNQSLDLFLFNFSPLLVIWMETELQKFTPLIPGKFFTFQPLCWTVCVHVHIASVLEVPSHRFENVKSLTPTAPIHTVYYHISNWILLSWFPKVSWNTQQLNFDILSNRSCIQEFYYGFFFSLKFFMHHTHR